MTPKPTAILATPACNDVQLLANSRRLTASVPKRFRHFGPYALVIRNASELFKGRVVGVVRLRIRDYVRLEVVLPAAHGVPQSTQRPQHQSNQKNDEAE